MSHPCDAKVVILRESGGSSTPRPFGSITDVSEYWVARSSRATTARFNFQEPKTVIARAYLPLYIAECQFKYNNRFNDDIFGTAIEGA